MKTKLSIICVLLFALLTALLVAAENRPTAKQFKGVELYSWQDREGTWLFSLLPGTNRLKTESEIKETKNHISSIKELENLFSQLAEGEHVYWFLREPKGVAYPDDAMIRLIESSAKKAKIILHLPKK